MRNILSPAERRIGKKRGFLSPAERVTGSERVKTRVNKVITKKFFQEFILHFNAFSYWLLIINLAKRHPSPTPSFLRYHTI